MREGRFHPFKFAPDFDAATPHPATASLCPSRIPNEAPHALQGFSRLRQSFAPLSASVLTLALSLLLLPVQAQQSGGRHVCQGLFAIFKRFAGAKTRIRALLGVANPRWAAIGPQDPFAVCALLPSPNCALLLLMAR